MTARSRPPGKRPIAQADAVPAQPPDHAKHRHSDSMFPPDLDGLPRQPALQLNPELALLAVLHTTLEALVLSLVAFYPHLATLEPPPDRETLAAHRLTVSIWHFQRRLTRYCRDLAARCAPPAPPAPSSDDALF